MDELQRTAIIAAVDRLRCECPICPYLSWPAIILIVVIWCCGCGCGGGVLSVLSNGKPPGPKKGERLVGYKIFA